ncbi:lysozyme inhibitor LprI family protein [Marilutibacter maris]|uniref:DUF1311 domain-containing protein n=1 Tax=Marilutibacter maris TaxID=1605891 RepID=A0A2U9T7X6_9GAMM|nr:lysozyme inhibitor LprI family protein [Lysobacter maris]AWV08653.1 hypothetical protein C9I47_2984 [Lysobacter maris]KAB8189930.1 DUF1311 domain-containing protein [Lysobacter maris]
MEKLVYLIVGAALTWAFYFVQRRVERRGEVDAIERHQKLLALMRGLETAETDLDELRRFEHRLLGRAETAARIADSYFSKAEEVARHARDVEGVDAIDHEAAQAFRRVDAELGELVVHLRRQLDGEALHTFEQAHARWLDYRERYARFIASSYSGGALRPLIHAVTLESVTLAWISELEMQLGDEDEDGEGEDGGDATEPEVEAGA